MSDHDSALFEIPIKASREPSEDVALQIVLDWFKSQRDMCGRFGAALRQSLDEVLDGQRTGRFDINFLEKTEKTYLGTKVEIVIRSEFNLTRGNRKEMDYRIEDIPIDSKFSLRGDWNIPREAMGHLCLLTTANDHNGTFSAGIIRISSDVLNAGRNQDGKATISQAGKGRIHWLCKDADLPPNLLLKLDKMTLEEIMNKSSGQQRINELIRRVQGVVIDRNTAVTVAQQMDGMKRCRDARQHIRDSGIVLLGHQKDGPKIAAALRLPRIEKGTFIAVRLSEVPESTVDRPAALIDGRYFAVALASDAEQRAPHIDL